MPIKFINLHLWGAIFSIFAVALSFNFSIDTYYSNENRIQIIFFLLGFAWLFRPKVVEKHPIVGYFGFFVFLFIGQRLVVGSFYNAHNWEHDSYTAEMVSETLQSISIYTIVFYFTLIAFRSQFKKVFRSVYYAANSINDVELKFKIIAFVFVVFGILSTIFLFTGGAAGHNTGIHTSFLYRYVFRIIMPDFLFFMLLAIFLLNNTVRRRYLVFMVAVGLYFLLMKVAQGSKAAIFQIMILLLLYFVAFERDKIIKVNLKFLIWCFVLATTSIVIFYLIDYVRFFVWYHASDELVKVASDEETFIKIMNYIDLISRRLTIFDDAMKVTNWEILGFVDIRDLVNVSTALKMSLDALIPSSVFPDLLKSQYALSVMLKNPPMIVNGVESYSGYWWGFYGYHHFVFGFWPGLMVMVSFLILNIIFIRMVLNFAPSTFKLGFFFTFVPSFFFDYVGFFGYEHISGMYVYNLLLWIANFLIIYGVYWVIRQFKARSLVHSKTIRGLINSTGEGSV